MPQLDAAILQQVRDLGHYPHFFKNPQTQDEIDERNLRERIRYHRKALHSDTLAELNAWKAVNAPQLDATILQQVHDLGHYPRGFKKPKTQDETDERSLLRRIEKRKALHSDTRCLEGRKCSSIGCRHFAESA